MAQKSGWVQQAGVIALHREQLCLVSSRGGQNWTLPKGCLKKGMEAWEVAGMEAWEEAGLEGRISTLPTGCYRYAKQGKDWEVQLFLMEVTQVRTHWPESHWRKRKWVDPRQIPSWIPHQEILDAVGTVFGWRNPREPG